MSQYNTRPNTNQQSNAPSVTAWSTPDLLGKHFSQDTIKRQSSNDTSRPDVIAEVAEPPSPDSASSSQQSPPSSILSEMLRNSPGTNEISNKQEESMSFDGDILQPAIVGQGIISRPDERTSLLFRKTAYGSESSRGCGYTKDIESQRLPRESPMTKFRRCLTQTGESGARLGRVITSPKSWDKRDLWVYGIREPANYIPPVILGLLLNILDALSYGR